MSDHIPQATSGGNYEAIQNLWAWLIGGGLFTGGGIAGMIAGLRSRKTPDDATISAITALQLEQGNRIAEIAPLAARVAALEINQSNFVRQIERVEAAVHELVERVTRVVTKEDFREFKDDTHKLIEAIHNAQVGRNAPR